MSKFWSKIVHDLTPYVPGEQPKLPNLVKLNTNENPYGPSLRALEAMRQEISDSMRLYPDPTSEQLREVIAHYHGLQVEQVFVGNGSDEILAHAFHALLKHEQPVLFPDITYSFYPVYCRLYGINYETVALDDNFALRVDDYLRPNGGIVFPNPNAPTGCLLALHDIERLLKANKKSVVVVDEAYVDFGGDSAATLVDRYPQLLVVQTLSKSRSLAGLRVGYALGHEDLIQALTRLKDSFNSYPLGRVAQAGAIAAMQDQAHFEMTCRKVIQSRKKLVKELEELSFKVLPSAANFILASHSKYKGTALAASLRERNIVVRHFSKPERISQFLRISIGTDTQCAALVSALREILG